MEKIQEVQTSIGNSNGSMKESKNKNPSRAFSTAVGPQRAFGQSCDIEI
jgi:hypothetical protein